jgi:ribosomal protein S27AE
LTGPKGIAMPFIEAFNETCPRCHQPIVTAFFELHPSNPDLALENFECSKCGPVKTKIILLKDAQPDAAA